MGDSGKLFDGGKFCSWCHCPIPEDSENDLCKNCQASMEFREIRDYVREHDVNEFQLAEIFEIPLRQVKQWIREGRLEYKELQNTMAGLHCQRCGKAIAFGNFCPECNRAEYGVQGGFETLKDDADEQIRFYKKIESKWRRKYACKICLRHRRSGIRTWERNYGSFIGEAVKGPRV